MLSYKESVKEAPCKDACPAGIDVPRYIRAIAEGKFDESLAVIREKIPFPAVCGRVCIRPCETNCNGRLLGDPIQIRALKEFVAERAGSFVKELPPTRSSGKSVAVVGAGPAGLSVAYYLAKLGHSVTIFEALSEPGGMMRVGIPDYRLPKDILRAEIDEIQAAGVDIKTNTRVESLDNLFEQGYDAIFLGLGAHQGMSLGIEGEDSSQVMDCVCFLRDVNLGKEVKIGTRVAVIGGGNAAIDSARVSLRLGAKQVTIVYRRTRAEMPGIPGEVEAALAEGIEMYFLAAPSRIYSQDGELKLECIRMQLGEPDASGRRRPEPIKGSKFTMSFDNIIAAIGQRPEIPYRFGLAVGRENRIQSDPDTMATSRGGVFAGGDDVSGPASVIEAIVAGRKAAIAIDKYLGGTGEINMVMPPEDTPIQTELQGFPVGVRNEVLTVPVKERLRDFSRVEIGFTEEQAVAEAKRCLRCDLPITVNVENCTGCMTCVMHCSLRFSESFSPAAAKLTVIPFSGGRVNEMTFTDECDTCGICARYCPHNALYRGEARPVPVVKPR